jgi:hypothetical protein
MSRFLVLCPGKWDQKPLQRHHGCTCCQSPLPSAQEMADSLQQLGRASALAQIGFCGWQESVLATAAQINLGGLLAHSAIVVLPERSRVA